MPPASSLSPVPEDKSVSSSPLHPNALSGNGKGPIDTEPTDTKSIPNFQVPQGVNSHPLNRGNNVHGLEASPITASSILGNPHNSWEGVNNLIGGHQDASSQSYTSSSREGLSVIPEEDHLLHPQKFDADLSSDEDKESMPPSLESRHDLDDFDAPLSPNQSKRSTPSSPESEQEAKRRKQIEDLALELHRHSSSGHSIEGDSEIISPKGGLKQEKGKLSFRERLKKYSKVWNKQADNGDDEDIMGQFGSALKLMRAPVPNDEEAIRTEGQGAVPMISTQDNVPKADVSLVERNKSGKKNWGTLAKFRKAKSFPGSYLEEIHDKQGQSANPSVSAADVIPRTEPSWSREDKERETMPEEPDSNYISSSATPSIDSPSPVQNSPPRRDGPSTSKAAGKKSTFQRVVQKIKSCGRLLCSGLGPSPTLSDDEADSTSDEGSKRQYRSRKSGPLTNARSWLTGVRKGGRGSNWNSNVAANSAQSPQAVPNSQDFVNSPEARFEASQSSPRQRKGWRSCLGRFNCFRNRKRMTQSDPYSSTTSFHYRPMFGDPTLSDQEYVSARQSPYPDKHVHWLDEDDDQGTTPLAAGCPITTEKNECSTKPGSSKTANPNVDPETEPRKFPWLKKPGYFKPWNLRKFSSWS